MINKIKQIRKSKGMALAEVAEKAHTSAQHLSRLENRANIDTKWLDILAEVFDVRPSDLASLDAEGFEPEVLELPAYNYKPIPVVSWVHAGDMTEITAETIYDEHVVSTKKTSPGAFALKVVGDSMEPRFFEDDIIIVDPEIMPHVGDFCVAVVDNEASFKLFHKDTAEHIILKPLNPKRASILIEKDIGTEFNFIGKVVDMKPKF